MAGPAAHGERSDAFSLVEVVIAIGIFSFCIISIIYLLGVALDSSRQSQIDSAMTGVLRNMDAELRGLPYNDPNALSLNSATLESTDYFFDSAGNLAANTANRIFRARLSRVAPAKVGTLTSVTNSTNHYLWVLKVAYPAPNFPLTNTLLFGRSLSGSGIANFYE